MMHLFYLDPTSTFHCLPVPLINSKSCKWLKHSLIIGKPSKSNVSLDFLTGTLSGVLHEIF